MAPAPDLDTLDGLTRDELITRARELGTKRPEVMTRVELRDEIVRLSEPDVIAQRRQRGWLGVARDLVASVVESGLNMRDAAAKIRGEQRGDELVGPPPVATVTLAEIYIAQGHPDRALTIVEEVLDREPDHAAALTLRDRLRAKEGIPERRRARVPEAEPDTSPPPPQAVEQVAMPEPEPEPEPAPAPEPAAEAKEVRRASVAQPACELEREGAGWIARWRGAPEGLILRVVAFVPSRPGPQQLKRDLEISGAEGNLSIADLPAGAVVRAALGRLRGDRFRPLAVAVVIDAVEGQRRALYRPPAIDDATIS